MPSWNAVQALIVKRAPQPVGHVMLGTTALEEQMKFPVQLAASAVMQPAAANSAAQDPTVVRELVDVRLVLLITIAQVEQMKFPVQMGWSVKREPPAVNNQVNEKSKNSMQ